MRNLLNLNPGKEIREIVEEMHIAEDEVCGNCCFYLWPQFENHSEHETFPSSRFLPSAEFQRLLPKFLPEPSRKG